MNETRVVNVRDPEVLAALRRGDPDVVYIGRANRRYGLPSSRFANPFAMYSEKQRASVIIFYRAWLALRLKEDVSLRDALKSLEGKQLACWCAPKACHGDVLRELLAIPETERE